MDLSHVRINPSISMHLWRISYQHVANTGDLTLPAANTCADKNGSLVPHSIGRERTRRDKVFCCPFMLLIDLK